MKYFYFFLFTLSLLGCHSTLKIKIDVMDRSALRRQPELVRLEAEQLYVRAQPVLNTDTLNQIKAKLKVLVDGGLEKSMRDGVIDSASKVTMIASNDTYLDKTIKQIKTEYDDGVTEYKKVEPDLVKAKNLFESAIRGFKNLKSEIKTTLDIELVEVGKYLDEYEDEFSISNANLLDDVLTSAVIHSPNRFWKKYDVEKDFSSVTYKRKYKKASYSKTIVNTFMGNSDIAITMENRGHFTVKGVRLDAAKVAEATFKGLTQSIHFLAMTSGLPIKASNNNDDATESVLPELDELVKTKVELNNTTVAFNESALDLVDVLLQQEASLISGVSVRKKAALNVVKTAFDTHKKQFNK